jgi:hypothetical protein
LLPQILHDLTFNTDFEFEQQNFILKTIRYLHEKQMNINDKVVLEFLKSKGEKNSKYANAYDYLFNLLNNSYYLDFSKEKFSRDGEKRLKNTRDKIRNYKKDLNLSSKIIKINELNKNPSDENKQKIGELLLEIKTIKKPLN